MKLLLAILCIVAISAGVFLYAQEKKELPRVIILLGPPGSGKGTQAVRLSQQLKIPHISTGDLFRDNLKRETELGKRAKSYMDAGKLVPDEVVLEMLFDRISKPDAAGGYLLDGFPRTIAQAEALDKKLGTGTSVVALNLNVSDDLIIKRTEGRLTCKQCGNVHNRYFSPPRIENQCDKCGGELYQRPDDAAAVVEERLRVYHAQTAPLVDYYTKKGILTNINGEQSPDAVFDALLNVLKQ